MNRVVRAFLVWVMVIAMPVQGMAASVMPFCGPTHERTMQGLSADGFGSVSSPSAANRHEDSVSDHDGRRHAAAEHSSADDSGAGSDADGTTSRLPHSGKLTCSACATCCSAPALPAGFVVPEPASPARHTVMAAVEPVASHQADGLDRPPRTRLA